MASFIYVICEGLDAEVSKIGISKNPDRRVRQLQTGHPLPLVVAHREEVDDKKVKGLERLIHRQLTHLRLKGEWFSLSPADAILEVKHALIRYGDQEEVCLRLNGGTFQL
jgi:hypothetical protein